ncbi:ABC transporter ATP-binding protein [Candidatus Saccharibacteria bacterium]|jgi:ATP-binding cassette subfamily B protein|nr:ABC transporter ATP-binding protein [Candidatus Saccharibacteria bacterium]
MKSLWRIITTTRELWKYYAVISIFTILLAMAGLAQPLLTGRAVDIIKEGASDQIKTVVWLAVLLFLLDFSTTIFSNISGYIGDVMSQKLRKILGSRYYSHLMKLPQTYYDRELTGTIIARLNRSVPEIAGFIDMFSNNFLQFIVSTIFSLVVIATISWPVAILLAALYPLYFFLTSKTSKVWMSYQKKINKKFDIALGRFNEVVNQSKVVKSFDRQDGEVEFYEKTITDVIGLAEPQSKFWHKRDVLRRIALNVIFFAVYLLIFLEAAKGSITTGQAVTLILLAYNIRIPIFTISFLVDRTQRAIADSKDYFEVLEQPVEEENQNTKDLQIKTAVVKFSDVDFNYNKKEQVLNNVSFTAESGEKTALVGESGEGKTTISSLLLGLYQPGKGSVTIDGQDIHLVSQSSLRQNIGVVFQDAALFSGTIFDNIIYGKPGASQAEAERVAKAANAYGFISKLENGYKTEIGERGVKLSGGQKQRIAIARALLKDAPILILDEATSSLDSKSEVEVQKALETLMRDRTTIIIAHRLSTISSVDTIVTLKNGMVDEIGSPQELAKTRGIYAELLKLQNNSDQKALEQFDLAS